MSGDILPEVHLVRHGETAWSLTGQATGRTDIPLTDRGERDAQELGTQLQGLSFVQILTSPLQRGQRTAELVAFVMIGVLVASVAGKFRQRVEA